MGPLISGKSRLVKYYNLARCISYKCIQYTEVQVDQTLLPLVGSGNLATHGSSTKVVVFLLFTPRKTNMSPENQWLEDVFPIEIVPF